MAVYIYYHQVFYDATGFLEKNRDTMSPDIVHVLRTSGAKFNQYFLLLLHFSYLKDNPNEY